MDENSHMESAAAGNTNITDELLMDLLRSGRVQKLLTERAAEITPLPCRRDGAIDEPTKKRRKIDETRNASAQNEVPSSPRSATSLIKYDSDGRELDPYESDETGNDCGETHRFRWQKMSRGDGGRAMQKNGEGVWRDANGNNRPIFSDLWGMEEMLKILMKEVIRPMHQFKLMHHLGVEPTSRILLHGPPGCGKTTLARAIANEAGVPCYEISAAELVSGFLGSPEESIRELFSKACIRAPSVVFIDEIDAVTSKSESSPKEIEPHIVNRLIASMDETYRLIEPVIHDAGSESSNSRPGYVLVIGATNRPHAVEPALRRRFDREFVIGVPDELPRFFILSVLLHNFKVEDVFDLPMISRCTAGFVGGDLVALAKKAGSLAVSRILDTRNSDLPNEPWVRLQFNDNHRQPFSYEEMDNLSITMEDFVVAGMMIRPSFVIEAFSTIPNAKWNDVKGLQLLKLEFERHIIERIKFPKVYKDPGLNLKTRFFLYGPSGCGKTLIVEALAHEAGAKFIHVKFSELLQYGDRSGLVVRTILNHAEACTPCILFFDELDIITRYDEDEGRRRDFRQLQEELNYLHKWPYAGPKSGVYIIVANNRPNYTSHSFFISLTGPEKGDQVLYVPLPSPEERGEILKVLAKDDRPVDVNVDLMAIGKDDACENFSGADLSALMREAAKVAINRSNKLRPRVPRWTIKDEDFRMALKKISPSVTPKQIKMCKNYAGVGSDTTTSSADGEDGTGT